MVVASPGNLARGDLLQQRIQGDCRHYSLQEPANCSSRADIHRADFQYRPVLHKFLVQIDIIDPHHLAAEDIDHLLVEQVASEQQPAFRSIARCPLTARDVTAYTGFDRRNRTRREHAIAGFCADDQHGDSRAILLRNHGQFAYTPAPGSGGIKDRSAEQFCERERGHIARILKSQDRIQISFDRVCRPLGSGRWLR